MKQLLGRRPSPAMVIALVALIAATSGTAIALPGKGKVDKNDIKKNAVGAKQIKKNAVAGSEVKNNSLRGADINESSLVLPTVANATNAQNAQNAQNAANAANAANADAVDGVSAGAFNYRSNSNTDDVTLAQVGGVTVQASCPGGSTRFEVISATGGTVHSSYITTAGVADSDTADMDAGDEYGITLIGATANGNAVVATGDGKAVTLTYAYNGDGDVACNVAGTVLGN